MISNIVLPKIQDEELLDGYIGRAAFINGVQPKTLMIAFKNNSILNNFYLSNKDYDIERILDKHTLFNFYNSFNLNTDENRSKLFFLPQGLNSNTCEKCVREDLKKDGYTYWKRRHQTPSVTTCYLHNSQLISTTRKTTDIDPLFWQKTSPPQPKKLKKRPSEFEKRYAYLTSSLLNPLALADKKTISSRIKKLEQEQISSRNERRYDFWSFHAKQEPVQKFTRTLRKNQHYSDVIFLKTLIKDVMPITNLCFVSSLLNDTAEQALDVFLHPAN